MKINTEKDLEELIISNLEVIEAGMRVIENQFEIKNGVIDILARDKNNKLTIIELKIRSDDKNLIYQCAYYPTQFHEDVRMIAIAPSYNNNIYHALNVFDGIEMKEYEIINNNLAITDVDKDKILKEEEIRKQEELIKKEINLNLEKELNMLLDGVSGNDFILNNKAKEIANKLKICNEDFLSILKSKRLCIIKKNRKINPILNIMGFQVEDDSNYIIVKRDEINPIFIDNYSKNIVWWKRTFIGG